MEATTNRWLKVIVGFIIQLCSGIAYMWSIFSTGNNGVVAQLNWKSADSMLAFSLLLAMLTFGGMVGGIISKKISPKAAVAIGGVIMGGGFIFAAFANPQTAMTVWLGYGILGGFGCGMVYTNVIAVTQKWFPDKRGLITGIIIAGLGASGVLFTHLFQYIIGFTGALHLIGFIGGAIIVICVVGSLFMSNPPQGFIPAGFTPKDPSKLSRNFTVAESLKTPQMYMIILAFMLATAAGFMVIPNAKGLAMGPADNQYMTAQTALIGVIIVSAFNAIGRIVWGRVSDKIGSKTTLLILAACECVSILIANFVTSYSIFVVIALVGFFYGGFLGVFPVLSADYYGTKNGSTIYGIVMFGFSLGAVVFSYTAGFIKDKTGSLKTAFYIAAAAAVVAFLIIVLLKAPKQKNLMEEEKII